MLPKMVSTSILVLKSVAEANALFTLSSWTESRKLFGMTRLLFLSKSHSVLT